MSGEFISHCSKPSGDRASLVNYSRTLSTLLISCEWQPVFTVYRKLLTFRGTTIAFLLKI